MSICSMISFSGCRFLTHRPLEGVQIHAHQVDRLDPVRLHGLHMGVDVTAREQSAMHDRMKRFDPAVHDLREAGDLLDPDDINAGL